MAQELLLADFRGGMDASSAVDKLDQTACLLADGVRLDESGNVLSAGAVTAQNSAALTDTFGNMNIHSLYFNPSFGAVAGVGRDVYQGPSLGGMTDGLIGVNTSQQKMSFASSPNRVYFDVGSTGYWTDLTNLLTVDWSPPTIASGSVITASATAGTAAQSGTGTGWTSTGGITGTSSFAVATVSTYAFGYPTKALTGTGFGFAVNTNSTVRGVAITFAAKFVKTGGAHNSAAIQASLLIGGSPTGVFAQTPNLTSALTTYTLGRSDYLWNVFGGISGAQVNAATFGVNIYGGVDASTAGIFSIQNVQVTVYQSPAGLVAGIGGAGGLTGTYTWKVTFVAQNGEESDASQDSNSIVLAAQSGTLTGIPAGDARTASRNIYRQGGALTSHYLVGSIPDNVSTTYNDSSTDISVLATGVILSGDVSGDFPNSRLGMTQVRFPQLHYDRVFWVIAGTNKVIWSKPLNGFAYPSVNFLNVGDNKPVTRILSKWGELIIYKTDSIWRLTGTDESSFSLSQTPSAVGTDLSFSILDMPDGIRFANRWGLWVFNGYTSQTLVNKLDLWFKQDDRTTRSVFGLNGMHPPEITDPNVPLNFEMVGNSEKIYWAYAEKNQPRNNSTMVFDAKRGNITKRGCTGAVLLNPLSLAIDPVTGFVYAGSSNGIIYHMDDLGASTSYANFDFQTGYVDVQRGSNKSLWALEFYINTNGQTVVPFVYYDNGTANESLATFSTTGLQRVVRKIEASRARECQNWSIQLNALAFPVNSLSIPQIQLVSIKCYYDIRTGRARTGQV